MGKLKVEDKIQLEGDLTRMLYNLFRHNWNKFELAMRKVDIILENYEVRKESKCEQKI